MNLWNWLTRTRDDHGWPGYIINGRIRTSTAALIVAFFVIAWVHNTYQPPPPTPVVPENAQVVPPGFMPDPEYTWVPRTNVETRPKTTSSTPTTTTSTTDTTTTTETTGPTSSTTGTPTSGLVPTTVVDPDGAGPLPPTTITGTAVPTTNTPVLPVPDRSGTSTTTTVLPGAGQASTTPPPPG